MPWVYREMYAAWRTGDLSMAQRWQFLADRIILAMRPYGIIAATKAVMGFLGIECGAPRRPQSPLDAAGRNALRLALEEAGYFASREEAGR